MKKKEEELETLRQEKVEKEEESKKEKEKLREANEKMKTLVLVVDGVVKLARKVIDKDVREVSKISVVGNVGKPPISTKNITLTLVSCPLTFSQNNFTPLRPLTITPPLFPLLILTNFILVKRRTFSNLLGEMSTARRPPPEPPPNTTLPYLICG